MDMTFVTEADHVVKIAADYANPTGVRVYLAEAGADLEKVAPFYLSTEELKKMYEIAQFMDAHRGIK